MAASAYKRNYIGSYRNRNHKNLSFYQKVYCLFKTMLRHLNRILYMHNVQFMEQPLVFILNFKYDKRVNIEQKRGFFDYWVNIYSKTRKSDST